ncbi:phytanoyl-CoA dioxygenase family protein [Roseibium algae]|uniref:Phytanoyl-CoA dioxygenase family protein n=1 Tax=Roseibium algae TaxID=3123038 RepID=A0ABU8TI93_9HYPH
MSALSYLSAPLWLLGVFGAEKSLRKNPILGNENLNRRGLHKKRVQIAANLAAHRRKRLAPSLSAEDREFFDENGYFVTRNFLSDEHFQALKAEVFGKPFEAREMRQGDAVTRMTPVPPNVLDANPALASALRDKRALAQIRYAASQGGQPIGFLQTVAVEPSGKRDPQTDVHSDTFHATSKAWLFLEDVAEEDGPFCFVPGSHKLTDERLEWQHQCSLSASQDSNSHHASGSFRIGAADLQSLGLPQPKRMAVPANTLIVADTFAFHGRTPSDKPTVRCELHWHMRRNPFLPWTGLDFKSLPGVRERELQLFMGYLDARKKYLNKDSIWKPVGAVPVNSKAHI